MKRLMSLLLVTGLFAAVGCGDGGVPVDGKVVEGSGSYTMAEGETINITLASEDGKTNCTGIVQKDATFIIKTSTGQGVPPGKYKVSFMHYHAAPPATGKGPPAVPPRPSPVDTGEVWDVSSSNKTFTFDMAKGKEKEKEQEKEKKKPVGPPTAPSSKK